jgi:Ca2+/Na+ antiporter
MIEILYILLIAASIAGIVKASDIVADELKGIVNRFALPGAVISIVGLSLATGLPEILMSIYEVNIGDVYAIVPSLVGSSLMHFLIIGLVAIFVTAGVETNWEINTGLIATMAVGSILFAVSVLFNFINYFSVAMLLGFFLLYIIAVLYVTRKQKPDDDKSRGDVPKFMVGIVVLVFGSLGLVLGINGLNHAWNLDASEVGFFLTAFAANLPEFLVIGTALAKAKPEMVVAGLLSGNIVNLGLGIGFVGVLSPIPAMGLPLQIATGGIIFLALVTLFMLYTGKRIKWTEGVVLVISYIAIAWMFLIA